MWSIVAIRAFRHSSCDWAIIDRFPPKQKPSLQISVLDKLADALDTIDRTCLLGTSNATLRSKNLTQLVNCMDTVVWELS